MPLLVKIVPRKALYSGKWHARIDLLGEMCSGAYFHTGIKTNSQTGAELAEEN